jgi:hypothetical protein
VSDLEAELLACEARRYRAQIEQDVAALDELLSDDLVYTHNNGQTDTKSAFIQLVQAISYRSIETSDVRIRLHGSAAVVTGIARIEVERDSQRRLNILRYVNVWSLQASELRNTLWQSTAMSAPIILAAKT